MIAVPCQDQPYSCSFIFTLTDVSSGSQPDLDPASAFRIFPIAHQYGMEVVMELCWKSLEGGGMTLWPSELIASSEVAV